MHNIHPCNPVYLKAVRFSLDRTAPLLSGNVVSFMATPALVAGDLKAGEESVLALFTSSLKRFFF